MRSPDEDDLRRRPGCERRLSSRTGPKRDHLLDDAIESFSDQRSAVEGPEHSLFGGLTESGGHQQREQGEDEHGDDGERA